MTHPQRRLLDEIRAHGGADDGFGAEYWPVVNDWVKDRGPAASLALRNINRTVDALMKGGYVTLNNDGCFHLTERGKGVK